MTDRRSTRLHAERPAHRAPATLVLPFFLMASLLLAATARCARILPETVMTPGMKITAVTPEGRITIVAGQGFRRTYFWDHCEGDATLIARHQRWYGSLGIYGEGTVKGWGDCDGVDQILADEGIQHFDSVDGALGWLRSEKYFAYVHTNQGLVVGWRRTPEREQLSVAVWQILVNGEKPSRLAGADDSKISVSFGSSAADRTRKGELRAELVDAAFKGDEARVRSLLAQGADPNSRSDDGGTALGAAALKGSVGIIRLLLHAGAVVNERSKNGELTPLHLAVMQGDVACVGALLQAGADVNARDGAGMAPLMYAAMGGNLPAVQVLLASPKIDVNLRGILGVTALMLAAGHGRLGAVELLLRSGADVGTKNVRGQTALVYAQGYPQIVQLLRKAKAAKKGPRPGRGMRRF